MFKNINLCLIMLGLSQGVAGCTAPSPVPEPKQGGGTLSGHVVTWSTGEPTLGAVAYRRPESQVRRVAYPAADNRGDKAFVTEHEVALLSVREGETVLVQLVNRTSDGRIVRSDEFEFEVGQRPAPADLLEWTMIDVGFGDSHLLTMPNTGKRILIDAGESRDFSNVDLFLRDRGIDRLDCVAGSHIHADHIGGLVGNRGEDDNGILNVYDVGVFLDTPNKSASRDAYDEVLSILERRSIPRVMLSVGATTASSPSLDWDPDVTVTVMNAGGGRSIGGDFSGDWLNNDSFVFRISMGDVDLIMGGDAEGPVESKLVGEMADQLNSEVLKVHHHGHRDASGSGFLDRVDPRVGLVPIASIESSSDFGEPLPHGASITRLTAADVDIFASDRAEPLGLVAEGDGGFHITVFTDGESYEVRVEPSRSFHFPGKPTELAHDL